jgi:lipoyl(octanoyl) transferase
MEARVEAISKGEASECVWLLEHPPIYTAGTSADPSELLTPTRFPVIQTGRGGRIT